MRGSSDPILVAGAGIGGLTAALALAARGFRVVVIEKAERLEEAGAGLQLSPNATRVLVDLGLGPRLEQCALAPDAISVMSGPRGTELVRLPLDGTDPAAPYWVMHRADLQGALAARVHDNPQIELRLGCQFDAFAEDAHGVTVHTSRGIEPQRERAAALIGADGLWSKVRQQLQPGLQPRFAGLMAWRGTVDTQDLPRQSRLPRVQLWMGSNAHLVTYPISQGRQTNIVAFSSGQWRDVGWSVPATVAEAGAAFTADHWSEPARAIIASVMQWRKWALFTYPAGTSWTRGRVALLGDAIHAMLPFAAQGAAMAIEDAAVLADCMAARPENISSALDHYQRRRQSRTVKVQALAERNGRIYHLTGPMAFARDLTMRMLGGRRLLARQNWVYAWHPQDGARSV